MIKALDFLVYHKRQTSLILYYLFLLSYVSKIECECNPAQYVISSSPSPSHYCSNQQNGWGEGTKIINGCIKNAVACQCKCESTGWLGTLAKCVSEFDSSREYCFEDTNSCVCPAGNEVSNCGCNQGEGGTWRCQRGDCNVCSAGKYADGTTVKCQSCPPNTYMGTTGASACIPCSVECGQTTQYISGACTSTTDIVCSTCPTGHGCNKVTKVECGTNSYGYNGECISCVSADGQICLTTGLSMYESGCTAGQAYVEGKCITTPKGHYTVNTLTQGPGTALNYHRSAPIPCPIGQFQRSLGSTTCELCDSGSYTSEEGSDACTVCEIGTYQVNKGGTTCTQCTIGKVYTSGSEECVVCDRGKFSNTNKSTSCTKCKGKGYNPMTGATMCLSCPEGKTTFKRIGDSLFDMNEVIDDIEKCIACPAGFYTCNCFSNNSAFSSAEYQSCIRKECTDDSGNEHSTCIPCTRGHYCPGDGFKYNRTMPIPSISFISTEESATADNVIRPCTVCNNTHNQEFLYAECTRTTDRVCKKCSQHDPMKTYVASACTEEHDTLIALCNETNGDMLAGGICNPCPPGSKKKDASDGIGCERCPANTSSPSGTVCEPCEDGYTSVAGSSRCTFVCRGPQQYSQSGLASECRDVHVSGAIRKIAQCEALQSTSNTGIEIEAGVFLVASNTALGRGYIWKVTTDRNRCSIPYTTIIFEKIIKILHRDANRYDVIEEGPQGIFIRTVRWLEANEELLQTNYQSMAPSGRYQMRGAIVATSDENELSQGNEEVMFIFSDSSSHSIYKMMKNFSVNTVVGTGYRSTPTFMSSVPPETKKEDLSFPSDIVETSRGDMFVLDDYGIWKFMHNHETISKSMDINNETISNNSMIFWCCSELYWNTSMMESKHIFASNKEPGVIVFGFILDGLPRVLIIRDQDTFTEIYDARSLFRDHEDSALLMNGMIASDSGYYMMLSSREGLGTEFQELGFDACLCNHGLFCEGSLQQCVEVPFGFYTRHWSNTLIQHPAGTIQGKQCPLPHYRTREPAGLNCESICTSDQIFDIKTRSCIESCDYDNGYYFETEENECRQCPLGTASILGKKGIKHSCLKCIPGKYGARPGVCEDCPANTLTIYDGSTLCMPSSGKQNASSICTADGVYGTDEKCAARRELPFFYGDSNYNSTEKTIQGISASSRGTLFVSTGNHLWRYNKTQDHWDCIIIITTHIEREEDHLCMYQYSDAKLHNSMGIIQISDDERTVYASSAGSSCIFRFSLAGGAKGPAAERKDAWAGTCESYGDMNGDRRSGRLGIIFGLALMEGIEGISSTLFVSTQSTDSGCMSIRTVSVSDGSIGTFASFNQVRLPMLILPLCIKDSSIRMASVRGSDRLYYSLGHQLYSANVLQYNVELGRLNPPTLQSSVNIEESITSICASPRNGYVTFAISADDTLHTFRYTTGTNLQLRNSNIAPRNMNAIGCAGQRIWYIDNHEKIREHSIIPEESTETLVCAAGFAYSQTHKVCVQVGIGQYTSLDDERIAVRMCKEGTFGSSAGAASNADCLSCVEGKISTESSVGCWACSSPNEFAMDGSCVTSCPLGTFMSEEKKSCKKCPPGYSSSNISGIANSSGGCYPCEAGSYANASTGHICMQCPEGWTSPLGAFKCVVICRSDQCGIDGEHCMPVRNKWEVMTSINVMGGINMIAVVASRGNGVFSTDGNNIKYFLDSCPTSMSSEEYESCSIELTDLLPTECSSARGITIPCSRGFSALAITGQYIDGLSGSVKYLYVSSTIIHCIYRFPIYYDAGRVDVGRTQDILRQSKLDTFKYIGTGKRGFKGGAFNVAMFSTISDLEIAPDDSFLIISDYNNHRIRKAHFLSRMVTTILGRGAACTRRGIVSNRTTLEDLNTALDSVCDDTSETEAYIQSPQGIGISLDMKRLYLALSNENAIAYLGLDTNVVPTRFDYTCTMLYEKITNSIETCDESIHNRKSCFLQRAYDVLFYGDILYASVRNGITRIDLNSQECKQIAGKYWDLSALSEGYEDGIFDETSGESSARFRNPYRIALAPDEGIMYIADLFNGAIRRFFVDSQCQCPAGNLKLEKDNTCYDSTAKWSDNKLIDCPPGQYAVEDEKTCRDCVEAMEMGITVSSCITWHVNALRTGQIAYPFLRVKGNPMPSGSHNADWYGTGSSDSPAQWDSIFKDHSAVRYRLGIVEGRAPFGGEYVSYRFVEETKRWVMELEATLQPKLLLPGLWYPCTTGPVLVSERGMSCSCPQILSAFESSRSILDSGERVSWHKLRMSAFENGARALGTFERRPELLASYARANSSYSLSFLRNVDRIRMWSKYVIFGTDASAGNGACINKRTGPCFPIFKHISEQDPYATSSSSSSSAESIVFDDTQGALEWSKDAIGELKCSVGWPAHYACPNGYVWVGVNSSELTDPRMSIPPHHSEQIACLSCLPGTFSYYDETLKRKNGGPYRCDMCILGKYSSSVGATSCELCPIGTYADTHGSTSCKKCPLSNYWTEQMGAQSALSCKPCRPGTGNCVFCGAGEYQSMSAQNSCLPCPIGHFSDRVNSSSCTPCPQNHVQGTPGSASCERCPLTTFPSSDRSRCISCDNETSASPSHCDLAIGGTCGKGCGLNYHWNAEQERCVRCERGLLNAHAPCAKDPTVCSTEPSWKIVIWDEQNRPGEDIISDCDPGYEANPSKTSCVQCLKGEYWIENLGCVKCPSGYFSNTEGSLLCNLCEPGTYGNVNGSSQCYDCVQGEFAAGYGMTRCDVCSAGKFSGSARSVSCELCSNGTFGENTGRITDCDSLCDAEQGYFSGRGATACTFCSGGIVQGVACVGCGYGMYQESNEVNGALTCQYCSPGLVNLNTTYGSIEHCEPCASATAYAPPNSKGIDCVEAPLGTLPNADRTNWTKCNKGTFRDRNESSVCTVCAPGYFADTEGQVQCTPCREGRYTSLSGSTTCFRCRDNAIAPMRGSTTCTTCPAGSVSSNSSSACTPCPPNTYQQFQTLCAPCEDGYVAVYPGSIACSPCPAWTVYRSRAEGCGVCDAGKVMRPSPFFDGVYECVKCPLGLHNPNAGATNISEACVPCGEGGGLVPSEDADRCITCATGRTSKNGVQCEDCTPGFFSSDGLMCQPCPIGEYTDRSQTTWCSKCPAGKYGNGTAASACSLCPVGTFANESGKSACDVCSSDLGFSSSEGSVRCSERKTSCSVGEYLRIQYDKPWKDNDCAECIPCNENEYTIRIDNADGLLSVMISELEDTNTESSSLCPGTLPYPSYRCISSERLPGQYLSSTNFAGSSSSSSLNSIMESLLQNVRVIACPDLLPTEKQYVDYVVGPTHDCYIGCKYGVNAGSGITSYLSMFSLNSNERPYQNVFLPRMSTMADEVCTACPLTTCPLGKYRPQISENCGPPCGLSAYRSLCGDSGSSDGCYGRCIEPPQGAETTGGSGILGSSKCPWACTLGWYVNEGGDGCNRCDSENACAEGFIMIPREQCLPYHTLKDVCKACAHVDGGRPIAWSNITNKCVYECRSGYYSSHDKSNCLPCSSLGSVSCDLGQYRDLDSCIRLGHEPTCKVCKAAEEDMPISFTSHGGTSAYNCSAMCNAGYHTMTRQVPEQYVIQRESQVQKWSSMNISCKMCLPDDNVPCHGKCAARYFRNTSVLLDTTPGACVKCKQSSACATGMYAPACTGNETADVPCLACNSTLLLDPEVGIPVRVFIPNSYINDIDMRSKITFLGNRESDQCPSVCAINYAQDPDNSRECKSCYDIAKQFDDFASRADDPSQPSPSSFIFSHWNATPDKMWWSPAYTPLSLKYLSRRFSPLEAVPRQGLCWACPPGRATQADDSDLCSLLPGYTTPEALKYTTDRVPIPVQGSSYVVTFTREPRPLFFQFSGIDEILQGRSGGRRLLLFLSGNTSSSGVPETTTKALLATPTNNNDAVYPSLVSCPHGWYKASRGEGFCTACPAGTSTVSRGSISVAQCLCYPGWRRVNTTRRLQRSDACTPCPVDTYRPLVGVTEDTCVSCGENETTHGRTNATMCACKVGFVRSAQNRADNGTGKCVECPKGYFCRPCVDLPNKACPPEGVHVFPCFSDSTSRSGSTSIENCTCNDPNSLVRMPRTSRTAEEIMTLMVLYGASASEFMYCFPLPPHAIYSESARRVTCKKGWTEILSSTSLLLQGCALCNMGQYAANDPSLASSLTVVNGRIVDPGLICVPCPVGTFSSSRDMIGNCTPCPPSQTTQSTGASSLDQCGCPPTMTKRASDGICVGCLPNQFISKSTGKCVDCPPFSITTSLDGTSECTCIPGYTTIPAQQQQGGSFVVSSSGCVPCPKNTYSSHASNRQCKACPLGSMTNNVGAKSIRECGASASLCSPGFTWKANFGCISSKLLL